MLLLVVSNLLSMSVGDKVQLEKKKPNKTVCGKFYIFVIFRFS